MLKFFIVPFFSMIFLMVPAQSAIIVAGDLTESEQEKVDSVLRTYTGATPTYFKQDFQGPQNPDVHNILRNEEIPFAEVEFLRNYFQTENIKAEIEYVPTTIWDLHVISKYLTSPEIKQSYKKNIDLSVRDKAFRTRYFELSNELMSILKTEADKNIPYFISLANNYLRAIDQNKIVEDGWSQALTKELQKIEKGFSSILHKMISEEMEAGEKNKILLVRATNGLPLKTQAQTREEVKKILQKQNRRYLSLQASPEEALEKMTNEAYVPPQWYEDLNPQGRVLDFPLKGSSAWESIHEFQNNIENRGLIETKDLSYGSSLLAGYLFDSFNRTQGACSFEYLSKKPETTAYTVHLDKDWLFSKGYHLFHLSSLETDGIFGRQEVFHPRLRSISPSSQMIERYKKLTSYSKIATDCIEMGSSFSCQHLDGLTDARKDNIKILEYVILANDILSQARVISFKGEILDTQEYSQEVGEILKNQKDLSLLLQTKVGGNL